MRDEVLEAEAVEESDDGSVRESALPARPLKAEVSAVSNEARTMAIAAAGGIVAGAATVVMAKAVSKAASSPSKRTRRAITGRSKRDDVIASRSFLVDVHLLGR